MKSITRMVLKVCSGEDTSKQHHGSSRNLGNGPCNQALGCRSSYGSHHRYNGPHRSRPFRKPSNNRWKYQPHCQLCEQMGHMAKSCSKLHWIDVTVNYVTTSTGKEKTLLLDSAASHNIMGDLSNLSIHSEYDGTSEEILGDRSGLAVSDIGFLELHSPNWTFILRDILCVLKICKNLIYVHYLTKQNNVIIEFYPFFLWRKRSQGRFYFEEHVKMVSIHIRIQWCLTPLKTLQMCMNRLLLKGGTSDLGIHPLKLYILLLTNFHLQISIPMMNCHFVVHVLLIKPIVNFFVSQA